MQFARYFQRASWSEHLARIAGPTLVGLCLAALVRDPLVRSLLKKLVVACFIAAFAAKEIADFPALWDRTVNSRHSGSNVTYYLSSLLPPEFKGWLRTLAGFCWGFWKWATRQPPLKYPHDGGSVTYLKRSGYSALLPLAVVSLFVDVPVSTFLLPALGLDPGVQIIVRSTMLIAGLFTIACLLGDRWHLSQGEHSIDAMTLHLRVGARFQAVIPLSTIRDAWVLPRTNSVSARWSNRELVASPFDKPNVMLVVNPNSNARMFWLGCSYHDAQAVYIYVDEPQTFVKDLNAKRGAPV